VFNVGCGNFQNSTLLRMVNAGKFEEAAAQFLRWNKASGKVMAGLTKRRADEAEMFLA
jgi:lysozyme